jgi:hypothetical protein
VKGRVGLKLGRVDVWGLTELQKLIDKADGRFGGGEGATDVDLLIR